MKRKNIVLIFITSILVVAMLICLITSDFFGVAIKGLIHITDDKDYTCTTQVLTDSVEFSLDLKNPSSNVGKRVFESENCYIEISKIDPDDEHFRVFFRAYGEYSTKTAKLITGTNRADNSVDLYAKLKIKDTDSYYECSGAGTSSMYKNGDEFGFYILPDEYIQSNNIADTNDISTLTLRLYDLTLHEWRHT